MTAHLSRRTLLGAVPSLAMPMALLPASVVEAGADSPILRLYGQWLAARERFADAPDDECEALFPQISALPPDSNDSTSIPATIDSMQRR